MQNSGVFACSFQQQMQLLQVQDGRTQQGSLRHLCHVKKTPLGWDHKVLGLRFGPIWAESFIITITAGFFHMYRTKREIHWKQSIKYVTVNLNHKHLVIFLYFVKWLPLKFGSLFGKGAGAGSCGFPCSLQIKSRRCLPSFTVP